MGQFVAPSELALAPHLVARTGGRDLLVILTDDRKVHGVERLFDPPITPLDYLPGIPLPALPPVPGTPPAPSARH